MKNQQPRRADVNNVEFVGGHEKRELYVVSYDTSWPVIFAEHQERIRVALAAIPVDIHHIGSTSVPGLAAKPIIDIVVAVDDITAEEDYLVPLLAAGYLLRVREPAHRLVRTPDRDVHVHLLEKGDQAVTRHLVFRDHLRLDSHDRELYAHTKYALIRQGFDDMNEYSDAKTDVIAAITARAEAQAKARAQARGAASPDASAPST
jgi:GrpB-like predicted nucleotidyltransferase (UPF0157 family)